MHPTIIAVDLAKNVFDVAVANERHQIFSHKRLSRTKFSRSPSQHKPAMVLFDSCGTAHFCARQAALSDTYFMKSSVSM